ncbi:MAG: sugar transferase [Candidatus Rokubacteria bacterium]|nr:sugar transferase [Candidatus Rokubacteria bacterium]
MQSIAWLAVRCLVGFDALLLAWVVAWFWTPRFPGLAAEFVSLLLIVPAWIGLYRYFGLYESHRVEGGGGAVRALATAQISGFLGFAALFWGAGRPERAGDLAWIAAASTLALGLPRLALYATMRHLRSRGFDARNVLVIGSWEAATEMSRRFRRRPDWGLRVACVGIGQPAGRKYCAYSSGEPLESSLEDLLRHHVIEDVLVAVPPEELGAEAPTLRLLERSGIVCRILLRPTPAAETPESRVEPFHGEVSLVLGAPEPRPGALLAKRAMDLAVGGTMLLACAPVMLVAAALIKLSSTGPVIFRQTRAGLHGRAFTMYKFRTMVAGAEALLPAFASRSVTGGPVFKDPRDVRITPVGRLLRRCSLDELPQLINVLKGEMSLVGPRPLPVREAVAVSDAHRRRFRMKPGLTCLWQVNGRSEVKYAAWMNYDLQYVDTWSVWLDAKLLLRTIPAVLSGRGAC